MSALDVSIVALIGAMILTVYELYASTQPQYRKGCNECDAVKRRADEVQREAQHDYSHKQGFECNDPKCHRNPKA